jgi:hypothetical protein
MFSFSFTIALESHIGYNHKHQAMFSADMNI